MVVAVVDRAAKIAAAVVVATVVVDPAAVAVIAAGADPAVPVATVVATARPTSISINSSPTPLSR